MVRVRWSVIPAMRSWWSTGGAQCSTKPRPCSAAWLLGRTACWGRRSAASSPVTSASELLLRAAVDPDDRGPHDLTVVAADGRPHQTEITIATLVVGDSDCFVLTIRDVTDRHNAARRPVRTPALTDPLTGLRNREGFLRQLDESWPQPPRRWRSRWSTSTASATSTTAMATIAGDDALRTGGASLSRLQGPPCRSVGSVATSSASRWHPRCPTRDRPAADRPAAAMV